MLDKVRLISQKNARDLLLNYGSLKNIVMVEDYEDFL
jgi:hypothetical protein